MNFKKVLLSLVLLSTFAFAQDKMVSVPESQLTEQQKTALKLQQVDTTIEKAHGWVGIGKEMGQAFDSALASLTERSNQFANTKVGKFTMFLVAWKVMGDQAAGLLNAIVHIVGGIVELAVFLPLFLWSYRRTCLDRKICTSSEGFFLWPKKTYEVVKFDTNDDEDMTQRWVHWVVAGLFSAVWLITVFSY